jgi:hypothetical protein
MQNALISFIGYGTVLTIVEIVIAAISVSLSKSEEPSMGTLAGSLLSFYILNIIFIAILSNIPVN